VLLLCWLLIWTLLGAPREQVEQLESGHEPRVLPEPEQPAPVREVMNVRIATEEAGVQVFRAKLRESASGAFEKLKRAFSPKTVPLLEEDEKLGAAILLLPNRVGEQRLERSVRPWLHWLLFALTLATTTWAGAAHQGVNLLHEPQRFGAGLPYSFGLMAILGVHELGHYFMAWHHGIKVTPPFFIPVPFALGTFGAFIQMRSPVENRRALFDVAVAGPLAGLVVAIPALLIGLRSSAILPGAMAAGPDFFGGTSAGSSLLFAMLAKVSLGDAFEFGQVLRLSPLAFAGWLGIFITALNLLPIGTLDGGHAARAMFGTRIGKVIGSVALLSLFLLALFVWPGLMTWALLVFFLAATGTPPLNDITPITPGRRWIGYITFLILALILLPLPQSLWATPGIHCPYS
jgi:Zn-dependent protease